MNDRDPGDPQDRHPRRSLPPKGQVRPSIPLWKRLMLQDPMPQDAERQFAARIGNEQDLRIFCLFGVPGPLPVGRCLRPVLADGQVFDACQLREQYVDPFCPDANLHHAGSLVADAVLMRARRTPVNDRQLRDMAPMLAQAAIEPFADAPADPAAVVVRKADEMTAAGLLSRGTGQHGVKAYTLTDLGRVRVEEHVRGKWWAAVN